MKKEIQSGVTTNCEAKMLLRYFTTKVEKSKGRKVTYSFLWRIHI